ncbi:MAG: phenylalanine--tRNA ligase subunit beta [Bacteroidota bacterium]
MKISYNWLKEYIAISESPEELAQLLTQSGLEVTEVAFFSSIKGNLNGLVIGQIITCEQHPNADRLKVTHVDVGQATPLHIVCGAPNVKAGQKVIVAPVGTQLYTQAGKAWKVKKTSIRGALSEGMICAEDEIGLGSTHTGIIVLDTRLVPGTPAAQHFNIQPDKILTIDITPNRADACSHLGVARELSALLERPVQQPIIKKSQATTKLALPIQIEVLDHNACPRYSGVIVSGVTVQQSPPWLIDKLKAVGLTPINNIVDVTNFVLYELGQPLHAFDYDQIAGSTIIVKPSKPATTFITLDGTTRKLSGVELMVCDQVGGISMAGILGGKRTSVHAGTKNIFLESAYFTPSAIREAAKRHAITTDASFRYERGTDPNLTVYALQRACSLLQEIAQGQVASKLIDLYPQKIENYRVKVHYNNITRLLGLHIPKEVVKQILSRLEIATSHEEEDGFIASIPPYRVDVLREVDVIEEIVRVYGYDRIEVTSRLGSTYLAKTIQPEQHKLRHSVAELLAANGYHEIYTNSLTKSSYAQLTNAIDTQKQIIISNPLSEALNALRQNMLFSGLEVIAHNINRKQGDLKLFEFGSIYHKREAQRYAEGSRLGIWLTGNIEAINWIRKPQKVTWQDMHAILHKILKKLNLTDFSTQPYASPLYQQGIQIICGQTPLMTAGSIHPSLLEHMGIRQPVLFADIEWMVLLHAQSSLGRYQEISKFPLVKRDLSLVLDKSVNFEAVKRVIAQHNNKLIRDVAVFDVYQGRELGQSKKAYTLRFVLQGKEKTLTDKAIDQAIGRLRKAFEDQLEATIRT